MDPDLPCSELQIPLIPADVTGSPLVLQIPLIPADVTGSLLVLQIPRVDDAEEYVATVTAMKAIGVQPDHLIQIQETTAGILCLGNIEFGDERDDSQVAVERILRS